MECVACQGNNIPPTASNDLLGLGDLQVDLVLVPAVTGDFGVMPGHVPTVAQLRPGVVTVHTEMDKDIQKFFVSSGFAFVHADSTADVVAVEAVKLDDLDTEAIRAGLQVCLVGISIRNVGVCVFTEQDMACNLRYGHYCHMVYFRNFGKASQHFGDLEGRI